MKKDISKLLRLLFFCLVMLFIIFVCSKTDVMFNLLKGVAGSNKEINSDYAIEKYSKLWYYSNLSNKEKEIYISISEAIENQESKVTYVSKSKTDLDNIQKIYEAIILDNPKFIYLDDNYSVKQIEIFGISIYNILISYSNIGFSNSLNLDVNLALTKLDAKVQEIIDKNITLEMTDYEKELAIHEYLINNVDYYEYVNIDDIPRVCHTAYGAIVNNNAVCDGISYAFKYIMEKLKIETIVVNGTLDNIGHSWNKVCINSKWYNVDVTSDASYRNKMPCHAYFNIKDSDIINTHVFDNLLSIPEAIDDEYNYYNCEEFLIDRNSNLEMKLKYIINNGKGNVLEFRVLNDGYKIDEIAQTLYNLNFNNMRNNKNNNFNYYQINDIYLFQK